MRTIYKYRLPRDGMSIEIHEYVLEFLNILPQHGSPHIWAVVDTDRTDTITEIVAWGTGWNLPDDVYFDTDYLGSCEDGDGYIWHYLAATRSTGREYQDIWQQDALPSWQTYPDCTKIAPQNIDPYYKTISISCDGCVDSAISGIPYDKANKTEIDYSLASIATCTGTVSSNIYNENVKDDLAELIGIIDRHVKASETATKMACR